MEFAIKTAKNGNKELYVDGRLYSVGTQENILLLMNQLADDINNIKTKTKK